MLTAAVRDLHRCHPGKFITDVRTSCPELWLHNPYITPLEDTDHEAEHIDCSYPLINVAHVRPYHCLHGFTKFLSEKLGVVIEPTEFRGDIHLSTEEKSWMSQVHEITGREIPFWIISAGGKFDVTIKWWSAERWQRVVDMFAGRVQFVQIGQAGHYHPALKGVIDLRGKTSLRQLVRLMYHAAGVVCPVTFLMHLAAAVETKAGRSPMRPCVVVAGGREPSHWESYNHHQFIHTVGALPCCLQGGCWKARTFPLCDEEHSERGVCLDVINDLPHCMHLIRPEAVAERIMYYFNGGTARFLAEGERAAALNAVAKTTMANSGGALSVFTARAECESFIQRLEIPAVEWSGRGIVIPAGGDKYLPCAWVCINMLRHVGCTLPIEIWHLGPSEMPPEFRRLAENLGVSVIDANALRTRFPARILGGWELKAYALLYCQFEQVLLLDADNVPVNNPEGLFDSSAFRSTGAVFWPDYGRLQESRAIWKLCGVKYRNEPEFESGQMLVHKGRCWQALRLALWFNEHSDFFYRYIHGDKDTFHMAFRKLGLQYSMPSTPIRSLDGVMCQHDFEGNRLFQHRNQHKWTLSEENRRIPGFELERECLEYLDQLRSRREVDRDSTVRLADVASAGQVG